MPITIYERSSQMIESPGVIENIRYIQDAVERILRDNKDLRTIHHRHIIKLLVEEKLKRSVSDESVPRACRKIQNEMKKYLPEEDDHREELAEAHRNYYAAEKR